MYCYIVINPRSKREYYYFSKHFDMRNTMILLDIPFVI